MARDSRGIDKGGIGYHIETSGDFKPIETFREHLDAVRKDLTEIRKMSGVLRKASTTSKAATRAVRDAKQLTKAEKLKLDIKKQLYNVDVQSNRLRNKDLTKARTELAIMRAKKSELLKRKVLDDKQVRAQRILTDKAKEQERIARRMASLKNQDLRRSRSKLSAEQAITRYLQKQADYQRRAQFARNKGLTNNQQALSDLGFSKSRAQSMGLMTPPTQPKKNLKDQIRDIVNLGNVSKRASGSVNRLGLSLQRMATALIFFGTARRVLDFFKEMVTSMVTFNAKMEQVRLGMATLFLAVGTVVNAQGKMVEGAEGLELALDASNRQVQMLRKEALKTVATFDELSEAFQTAIGPGLSAGLNLDQIRKFTVQISQAAATAGLPQNQLAEEIRSILQGTINTRFTRIATILNISNKDIKNAKEMGNLAQFLNKKFMAFNVSASKVFNTYNAIITNLKDALMLIAGEGGQGLFNTIKEQFLEIRALIIDPETLTPHPDALKAFQILSGHLSDIVVSLVGFIPKNGGVKKMAEAFDTLGRSLKTVVSFLLGVGDALAGIMKTLNKLSDMFSDLTSLFGGDSNTTRSISKWLTYLFVGKAVLPINTGLALAGKLTKSWNVGLKTAAVRWMGIAGAVAVATKNVVELYKRFKDFQSEKAKGTQASTARMHWSSSIPLQLMEHLSSLSGHANYSDAVRQSLQENIGGSTSITAPGKASIRHQRLDRIYSNFQKGMKDSSAPIISGPVDIKQMTEDIDKLTTEINNLEKANKKFVGGSSQGFLGILNSMNERFGGTRNKVAKDITGMADSIANLNEQIKEINDSYKESGDSVTFGVAKKIVGYEAKGASGVGRDLLNTLDSAVGGTLSSTMLEDARKIQEINQKIQATQQRSNELKEQSINYDRSIKSLTDAQVIQLAKSSEYQNGINRLTVQKNIEENKINEKLSKRLITLKEANDLREKVELNQLQKAADLEDRRLKTEMKRLTELKKTLTDYRARAAVDSQIEDLALKREQLFGDRKGISDKPEYSGFTGGMRRAADKLPEIESIYLQTGENIANGIGQTIGKAVTDALDPSKKSMKIKDRFLTLFKGIADIFIQEMIRAQVVRFIAGAVSPVPTGGATGGRVTSQGIKGYAEGGGVFPRPSNIDPRDTVPAWLRPGEFVIRPEVVKKWGAGFFAMINNLSTNPFKMMPALASGMNLRSHAIRGFAEGGAVGDMSPDFGMGGSGGYMTVVPVMTTDGELMEQILQGGGDAVLRDFIDRNSDVIQTSDRRADRGSSYD